MKLGPIFAMVIILGLSAWVMYATSTSADPTPGSKAFALVIGSDKVKFEQVQAADGSFSCRFLSGPNAGGPFLSPEEFQRGIAQSSLSAGSPILRVFNVSSYRNLAWVALGLGGQIVFAGRMIIQWLASERERRSVVPPAFWYMSLGGAICLSAYFIWRHDIVGVLGQTMGLVVYVRNIRLIHAHKTQTAGSPTPASA